MNVTEKNGLIWICAFGLTLFGLCSCTSFAEYKRMGDLEETLDAYNLYIKWSEFSEASQFRKPGQPASQYVDIESLNDFQVTSYEVKKQIMTEQGQRMERVVEVGYYNKNEMNVKTISVQEIWEYDEERKRWLLTTPLPALQ
jgi:hypothetical protein